MYRTANVAELLELMKSLQGERTQTEFASSLGVSTSYLNDVYHSRRPPSDKILGSIGIESVTNYFIPDSLTINMASAGGSSAKEESRKEIQQEKQGSRKRRSR